MLWLTLHSRFFSSLAGRMGVRWLAVLFVLAFFAQASLSFPEEEEEVPLDEPERKL